MCEDKEENMIMGLAQKVLYVVNYSLCKQDVFAINR